MGEVREPEAHAEEPGDDRGDDGAGEELPHAFDSMRVRKATASLYGLTRR